MKTCTKCEETNPLSEYSKHTTTADKLQSYCKACCATANRKRYLAHKAAGPSVVVTHKVCSSCDVDKPATEFSTRPTSSDGLRHICSVCKRESELLRKYGLTLADYDAMFDAQGGCCAICQVAEVDAVKGRFNVDHCHTTGTVRGLLCHRCNTSLGLMNDDTTALAAAINYLETNA